jgi:hypothetical protein
MDESARQILIEGAGTLGPAERRRVEQGDAAVIDEKLEALDDDRAWMWTMTGVGFLMAVVLPTAGLYKLFREVNNFEAVELVAALAGACLLAALLTVVPVVLYTNWKRRRLCLQALRASMREEQETEAEPSGRPSGETAATEAG